MSATSPAVPVSTRQQNKVWPIERELDEPEVLKLHLSSSLWTRFCQTGDVPDKPLAITKTIQCGWKPWVPWNDPNIGENNLKPSHLHCPISRYLFHSYTGWFFCKKKENETYCIDFKLLNQIVSRVPDKPDPVLEYYHYQLQNYWKC